MGRCRAASQGEQSDVFARAELPWREGRPGDEPDAYKCVACRLVVSIKQLGEPGRREECRMQAQARGGCLGGREAPRPRGGGGSVSVSLPEEARVG